MGVVHSEARDLITHRVLSSVFIVYLVNLGRKVIFCIERIKEADSLAAAKPRF